MKQSAREAPRFQKSVVWTPGPPGSNQKKKFYDSEISSQANVTMSIFLLPTVP
jgi:hypothetical protein